MNDDLISRQAAIDVLSMMQGIVSENGVRKGISIAWQQIKDLPSIAERKKGKWIFKNGFIPINGYWWECDQCGTWQEFTSNYCSHCGAYMREDDD